MLDYIREMKYKVMFNIQLILFAAISIYTEE